MDDYLHDMALFVEIARAGTLSRASKATAVPISTLSRRLSEFEKRIGLQLVKRNTRALELTELGRQYFARCESIVIGAASAHEELLRSSEQVEGTLKLSMTPDFGATVLAPLLVEFARIHPLINFELDLTPALKNLVESDIDIAIRFGHPEDSRLIMRRVGTISHWLCATPSYLSANSVPTTPDDLKKHNGILLRRARDLSPWSFAKEGPGGGDPAQGAVPGQHGRHDLLARTARRGNRHAPRRDGEAPDRRRATGQGHGRLANPFGAGAGDRHLAHAAGEMSALHGVSRCARRRGLDG